MKNRIKKEKREKRQKKKEKEEREEREKRALLGNFSQPFCYLFMSFWKPFGVPGLPLASPGALENPARKRVRLFDVFGRHFVVKSRPGEPQGRQQLSKVSPKGCQRVPQNEENTIKKKKSGHPDFEQQYSVLATFPPLWGVRGEEKQKKKYDKHTTSKNIIK